MDPCQENGKTFEYNDKVPVKNDLSHCVVRPTLPLQQVRTRGPNRESHLDTDGTRTNERELSHKFPKPFFLRDPFGMVRLRCVWRFLCFGC